MCAPEKAIAYLQLARQYAQLFSRDPHTQVAALFIAPSSQSILSSGCNSFPRGVRETEERWERPTKYTYVTHAEINGICNAARHGTSLENSIAVTTLFPCVHCTKAMIQVGIKTLVTERPDLENPQWGDEFRVALSLLSEAGIDIMYIPG
jgi:dCMP deaminase